MISTVLPFLSEEVQHHTWRTICLMFLGVSLGYLIINEYIRRAARVKGFSGPTNWPLVGNIPDIKYNAAEKYRQWAKVFGDVYQIQLGNVPVIVVNSAEAARKLFGQNSQALSSRPVFWTFHKVRRHSTRPDALLQTLT
jgi:3-hydroxyphenylacetate 6-hydroxylase